ncbi:MAG: response regulator [Gammaproteobacteria bacterium]|jgi:two-component system, OmpR family, response regulator BaeR
MNNPLILIVEDEAKLAQLLHEYLSQENYRTHCIANGLDVVPWVESNSPALILLDVMLPGKDGMEICEEIRSFSQVPIIMVTARVDEIDRLLGLELGADDYICKPFHPREVVARVKAVLRRAQAPALGDTAQDVFEIDDDKHQAIYRGSLLELTVVEFRLLKKLLSRRGKVFSRDQLLDQLYDDHRIVNQRTIDTHIKKLRKKLELANPEESVIRSVYGVGYKVDI